MFPVSLLDISRLVDIYLLAGRVLRQILIPKEGNYMILAELLLTTILMEEISLNSHESH